MPSGRTLPPSKSILEEQNPCPCFPSRFSGTARGTAWRGAGRAGVCASGSLGERGRTARPAQTVKKENEARQNGKSFQKLSELKEGKTRRNRCSPARDEPHASTRLIGAGMIDEICITCSTRSTRPTSSPRPPASQPASEPVTRTSVYSPLRLAVKGCLAISSEGFWTESWNKMTSWIFQKNTFKNASPNFFLHLWEFSPF